VPIEALAVPAEAVLPAPAEAEESAPRPAPPGPASLELINFEPDPTAETVLAVEGWPVPPETNSATTEQLLQETVVLLEREASEADKH